MLAALWNTNFKVYWIPFELCRVYFRYLTCPFLAVLARKSSYRNQTWLRRYRDLWGTGKLFINPHLKSFEKSPMMIIKLVFNIPKQLKHILEISSWKSKPKTHKLFYWIWRSLTKRAKRYILKKVFFSQYANKRTLSLSCFICLKYKVRPKTFFCVHLTFWERPHA